MPDFAQLSLDVARLLTESETAAELFPSLLKLLGLSLGWDYAGLWRVDYDRIAIRCAATWVRSPGKLTSFEKLSQLREFPIGVGLPGRVWESRKPVWLEHIGRDENLPRLNIALNEGLLSAAACPISAGKSVVGALEFFGSQSRAPEPATLEFLSLVGAQIGLFVERIRAEEALTSTQAQFELLAAKAIDPIVTIGPDSVIVFVNAAMESLFGYTRAELVGNTLTMIIPERLREAHRNGMRRYLSTGTRKLDWNGIVLPALHKNGTEFNVEVRFGEFNRADKRLFSGYIRKV